MPGRTGLAAPGWMCRYSCLWRSTEDLCCSLFGSVLAPVEHAKHRQHSVRPQLTRVGCAEETKAENKLPQMALSYLGSWSGSILPLSMDHPLSPFPPAAIGQAPAHRGDPSPRLPACPCLVLGTASAAWPGGVTVGLLAMPQLSILASCLLPGHNISWPVVSSAEVSFILNVFGVYVPTVWQQLSSEVMDFAIHCMRYQ